MFTIVKEAIKYFLGIYDYDAHGKRLIQKMIDLSKKSGRINELRTRRLFNIISKDYSCGIWPQAKYGENFYVAHPQGIRVGCTAEIGDNCKIYPYSEIVAAVKGYREKFVNGKRRHAKIGDNCVIGSHSMIIGDITIGNNVTIGAGAIVTKNIPVNVVVKNVNQYREKKENEIYN